MNVICCDPTVSQGKLAQDAVYRVVDIRSGPDGDYFVLAETGTSTWFVDRFRPFNDNSQFLSGADEASGIWNNRKSKERAQ